MSLEDTLRLERDRLREQLALAERDADYLRANLETIRRSGGTAAEYAGLAVEGSFVSRATILTGAEEARRARREADEAQRAKLRGATSHG
jgi:multidrug efflux pump subunit AcrA (membrane-fusion protein)